MWLVHLRCYTFLSGKKYMVAQQTTALKQIDAQNNNGEQEMYIQEIYSVIQHSIALKPHNNLHSNSICTQTDTYNGEHEMATYSQLG